MKITVNVRFLNTSPLHAMYASPAAAEPHCGFEANPDLYGLGIRIGVYLQSFACIFLNVIREQASHSILTAGNLLYLAILTALIVLICRDESFEVTEAYIVLVFLSTIPGKYLQRLEVQQIGWSGRHITRAVVNDFLGVLDVIARLMKRGVAIWFWWKGIDVLVNSPCTGYGFFFSKVLLDGWYRTLMKVLSIIDVLPALAFAGQLLLGYPPVIRKALLKSLGSVERVYHVMFVYNIVMFVVHVVATELTVRWNHIGEHYLPCVIR